VDYDFLHERRVEEQANKVLYSARACRRRIHSPREGHRHRALEELLSGDLLLVLIAGERLAVERDRLHVLGDERIERAVERILTLGLVDGGDALLGPGGRRWEDNLRHGW